MVLFVQRCYLTNRDLQEGDLFGLSFNCKHYVTSELILVRRLTAKHFIFLVINNLSNILSLFKVIWLHCVCQSHKTLKSPFQFEVVT